MSASTSSICPAAWRARRRAGCGTMTASKMTPNASPTAGSKGITRHRQVGRSLHSQGLVRPTRESSINAITELTSTVSGPTVANRFCSPTSCGRGSISVTGSHPLVRRRAEYVWLKEEVETGALARQMRQHPRLERRRDHLDELGVDTVPVDGRLTGTLRGPVPRAETTSSRTAEFGDWRSVAPLGLRVAATDRPVLAPDPGHARAASVSVPVARCRWDVSRLWLRLPAVHERHDRGAFGDDFSAEDIGVELSRSERCPPTR